MNISELPLVIEMTPIIANGSFSPSICSVEYLTDPNYFWSSPQFDIPKCIHESFINVLPTFLLLVSVLVIVPDRNEQAGGIIKKRPFFRLFSVTLLVAANLLHLSESWIELSVSWRLNYNIVICLVNHFTKFILYFGLGLMIYNNPRRWHHGLLWLATAIEALYSFFGAYLAIFGQQGYTIVDQFIFPVQLLGSILLFVDLSRKGDQRASVQLSPIKKLFLWWFVDILKKGFKNQLQLNDLPGLGGKPPSIKTYETKAEKFRESATANPKSGVTKRLVKLFWKELVTIAALTTIREVSTMTLPIFIKLFVGFLENGTKEAKWHGLVIGLPMIIITLVIPLIRVHESDLKFKTKARMQICINSAIYGKVLRMNSTSWGVFSVGKVLNLVAIDSTSLTRILDFINYIFSTPIRLTMGTLILYQMGGLGPFYGLGAWILVSLISSRIGKKVGETMRRKMALADKRVRLTNEILNGIKSVKFYAWEECFMKQLSDLREEEVSLMKRMDILQSISTLLDVSGPIFATFAIFFHQVIYEQRHLSIQNIFSTLGVIELLGPIFVMALVSYNITVMAMVSASRIDDFFKIKELANYVQRNEAGSALKIIGSDFSWESKQNDGSPLKLTSCKDQEMSSLKKGAILKDLTFQVDPGNFVCVIGSVGSGKSSMLQALLGEMMMNRGMVNISKECNIAFVPQEAWLQNQSVRDNILFGKPFDESKYLKVLTACELLADISVLPNGDETEIGDRGINLSGGQKQRISLARAVYNDADIYLLDDCLSAVDAYVSKQIYEQVLSSETGLLKKKTRLLATNKLDFLSEVDKIIYLEDGSIIESGSFEELQTRGCRVLSLISSYSSQPKQESESNSGKIAEKDATEVTEKSSGKLIQEEFMEKGGISGRIYMKLFKSCSKLWLIIAIISGILTVSSAVYARIVLTKWPKNSPNIDQEEQHSLMIFGISGAGQVIFTFLWVLGVELAYLKTCKTLHQDLMEGVFHSPLKFFDTTPLGRILNRFSKEMNGIDVLLRNAIRVCALTMIEFLPTIVGSIIQTPFFLIIVAISVVIVVVIWVLFMPAYRQLKRLESIAKSPVYSYFKETVSGATCIRAFQVSTQFAAHFNKKITLHTDCEYLMSLAVSLREMVLGALPGFIFTFIVVLAMNGYIVAAQAGLLFTYALKIMDLAFVVMTFVSEVEVHLVATERILEYAELPSEGDRMNKPDEFPSEWPSRGRIEFHHFSAKYRPELNYVVKNIDTSMNSKEKIGVVGRTGVGKSSITLALFRMLGETEGSITIDDQDINEVGLFHLRSGLSIIPQDPVIFSGTLRFNLDPFKKYPDSEIWRCLELSHMKAHFEKFNLGLEYVIEEGGKNLSAGQKQLMCLARSLLKKPKILVLDEATGSIDMETDQLVQETLRNEFKESIMIIIAHRLNTILNCDRILVLDSGRIAEFDTPRNLLSDESGLFYSLAKDAQFSLENN